MAEYAVSFYPQNKTIKVKQGSTLLDAALRINLTVNNICGGDGICGRCKMIVKKGDVSGKVSGKLSREEIKKGYVLACMSFVESDLIVEIPAETWAREKVVADEDADRFRDYAAAAVKGSRDEAAPLIRKVFIRLPEATLWNNTAAHQQICEIVRNRLKMESLQMGLKIIKALPGILEEHNNCITATVGIRRDIAEIMNIEGGNTEDRNFIVIVDIGTTTIVTHLADLNSLETMATGACFNSQGVYGRDVTSRIIAAEKKGTEVLQQLLIEDINGLIRSMARQAGINFKEITAVVCAGNTTMEHFLLGLPTHTIRRTPYVPITVEPPPFRAAEAGIEVNPRGLLYALPGISGWVGGDLTAGILATGIHLAEEVCLLVDIGTNGEIIIGNKDWLITTSASAGPALEGANEECGMRAARGAIEKVFAKNGKLQYRTIDHFPPRGICGSGIIDLVSVMLQEHIIDRTGRLISGGSKNITSSDGIKRYNLVSKKKTGNNKEIFITEADLDNIITAKAAIYAAMKILCKRLDLNFSDISRFYIAGAFGNYINIENAINIGLIPEIDRSRIRFVGNTSLRGAKMAAFNHREFYSLSKIRSNTTFYDLMGAEDYIEEFKKAIFLPHTDIEEFTPARKRA